MKIIRGSKLQFIPASHEDPKAPGVLKKILATKEELFSGRVQMINWAKLPLGASFRRHYHEDMEEIFLLLNGPVEVTVDGAKEKLNSGDMLVVSPREVHEMKNESDTDVEYIVIGISGNKNGKTIVVEG